APLGGLERSGWRLGNGARPGPYFTAREADFKMLDLRGSLGLTLGTDKWDVVDVVPGSPADRAGLAPGGQLVAVNGRRQAREVLADAIEATSAKGKLELLVEDAGFFRSFPVEYRGGPRYPVLERDPSRPDLLAAIAAPRSAAK
ncbi:MAG TPA: PDZ domain-containing protein, partial [Anaeromyxobacteraceae bacterium]|nr:PDZ domain-containing protein [Anaeromyxobacteraceae bacterium]